MPNPKARFKAAPPAIGVMIRFQLSYNYFRLLNHLRNVRHILSVIRQHKKYRLNIDR